MTRMPEPPHLKYCEYNGKKCQYYQETNNTKECLYFHLPIGVSSEGTQVKRCRPCILQIPCNARFKTFSEIIPYLVEGDYFINEHFKKTGHFVFIDNKGDLRAKSFICDNTKTTVPSFSVYDLNERCWEPFQFFEEEKLEVKYVAWNGITQSIKFIRGGVVVSIIHCPDDIDKIGPQEGAERAKEDALKVLKDIKQNAPEIKKFVLDEIMEFYKIILRESKQLKEGQDWQM